MLPDSPSLQTRPGLHIKTRAALSVAYQCTADRLFQSSVGGQVVVYKIYSIHLRHSILAGRLKHGLRIEQVEQLGIEDLSEIINTASESVMHRQKRLRSKYLYIIWI